MMLLFHTLLLLLSFLLLYFFTEYAFIPSLDRIRERWGMSSDIAGSTLMAVGSSAPELAVMIISVMKQGHHEAIGVGTIVGSALFNLFVITGVVMIVRGRQKLTWQPLVRDLLFYVFTILILVWVFHDGKVTMGEASLFLVSYVVYLWFLPAWKKIFPYPDREQSSGGTDGGGIFFSEWGARFFQRIISPLPNYLVFFFSVVFISFLAWVLVTCAIEISLRLGVPEFLIAIVVIAAGTSVPDLVSSAVVARKGRAGMAINNAVGSNIFDILVGLGLPLFFYYLFSSQEIRIERTDLRLSLAFLMGSVFLLLLFFRLSRWTTRRSAGVILILLYLLFLLLEIMGKIPV